ncbi:hypothetical protein RFI_01098 [Reticulomyxa filosa]|uniref:Uncharacterized protein n=1 Tax=Reticulomyxa filosa TaxID=46433 RepID=X6PD30_RETFI|nr:hypothetical protein RFI_01098 [Reticulomyxa filosa]|eukprot:ETO35964.1 hypothetical protein RFI_01098 [Reticulomyxa filosa]
MYAIIKYAASQKNLNKKTVNTSRVCVDINNFIWDITVANDITVQSSLSHRPGTYFLKHVSLESVNGIEVSKESSMSDNDASAAQPTLTAIVPKTAAIKSKERRRNFICYFFAFYSLVATKLEIIQMFDIDSYLSSRLDGKIISHRCQTKRTVSTKSGRTRKSGAVFGDQCCVRKFDFECNHGCGLETKKTWLKRDKDQLKSETQKMTSIFELEEDTNNKYIQFDEPKELDNNNNILYFTIAHMPIGRHERLLSFSRHTTSSSINIFQKYFNCVQHLISAFNIYMWVHALFSCFEKDLKNMLLKKDKFIVKSNDRQYSQPRSLNLFSQQEQTQIGRFGNYLLSINCTCDAIVFLKKCCECIRIYTPPKYTHAIETLIYFTYPKVTATHTLNMYTIDDINKETKVRLFEESRFKEVANEAINSDVCVLLVCLGINIEYTEGLV